MDPCGTPLLIVCLLIDLAVNSDLMGYVYQNIILKHQ